MYTVRSSRDSVPNRINSHANYKVFWVKLQGLSTKSAFCCFSSLFLGFSSLFVCTPHQLVSPISCSVNCPRTLFHFLFFLSALNLPPALLTHTQERALYCTHIDWSAITQWAICWVGYMYVAGCFWWYWYWKDLSYIALLLPPLFTWTNGDRVIKCPFCLSGKTIYLFIVQYVGGDVITPLL